MGAIFRKKKAVVGTIASFVRLKNYLSKKIIFMELKFRAWSKKNEQFMFPEMLGIDGKGRLVLMKFASVFEAPAGTPDGLWLADEEELADLEVSMLTGVENGEEVWTRIEPKN